MREILFRGKRVDNGEWISSGTLLTLDGYREKEYFIPELHGKVIATLDDADNIIMLEEGILARVDPSTVGQYTGVTDKTGKKIFEGDIVLMPKYGKGKHKAVVYFKNGKFAVDGSNYDMKDLNTGKHLEVIGNIYDNPELMEG